MITRAPKPQRSVAAEPRRERAPAMPAESGEPSLLNIKKILVPLDFSDCSKKALRYAVALARQFGAELVCLHVVEIPYGAGEAGMVVEMQTFRKNLQAESRRALAELVEAEAPDVTAMSRLRSGAPHHEIALAAQELEADLIVISTHGRTGLGRFFLGGTTERVVRHAPCPVLVVREREHDFIQIPEQPSRKGRAR
jgi:nucleotide-binding universal stress UspA family protein